MQFTSSSSLLFLLLLLPLLATAQNSVYINSIVCQNINTTCGSYLNPCFSIPAALSAAADGDTLLLSAGTYPPFTITNRRINIVGSGAAQSIIQASNSTAITITGPSNVSISFLGITGGSPFGIDVVSASSRLNLLGVDLRFN